MATITSDYPLKFRKSNGDVETYYGYDSKVTNPSLQFRTSNGITRYIPLQNNNNGTLKVRYNDSIYSVDRQSCTISVPYYAQYVAMSMGIPVYSIDMNTHTSASVASIPTTINNVFDKNISYEIISTDENSYESHVYGNISAYNNQYLPSGRQPGRQARNLDIIINLIYNNTTYTNRIPATFLPYAESSFGYLTSTFYF